MNNKIKIVLALLMTIAIFIPITALAAEDDVKVYVNGEELAFDQPPIIENGRTLVPLRAIFEALGAEVDWDQETKTVYADWGYNSMVLTIGEDYLTMGDGRVFALDVPAKVLNGRTLVPLRAVSESMGAEVYWEQETRSVWIYKLWESYYVDNVDDLIASIHSDARITLAPGVYNLTEWIEKRTELSAWDHPHVIIEECHDGYELQLHDLNNFGIVAEDPGKLTQIVVEPRYADVLAFVDSTELTVEGLSLGHVEEQGSCMGDVISFLRCQYVSVSECDIFGCGAYGLIAEDSDAISIFNSTVRDCTYGIATLTNTTDVYFGNVTIRDNIVYSLFDLYDSNIYLYDCSFWRNDGASGAVSGDSEIIFEECDMDAAAFAGFTEHPEYGSKIKVEGNLYYSNDLFGFEFCVPEGFLVNGTFSEGNGCFFADYNLNMEIGAYAIYIPDGWDVVDCYQDTLARIKESTASDFEILYSGQRDNNYSIRWIENGWICHQYSIVEYGKETTALYVYSPDNAEACEAMIWEGALSPSAAG